MIDANTYYLNQYLANIEANDQQYEQHIRQINMDAENLLSKIDADKLLLLFTGIDDINNISEIDQSAKCKRLLIDLTVRINHFFQQQSPAHATLLGFSLAAYLRCKAINKAHE